MKNLGHVQHGTENCKDPLQHTVWLGLLGALDKNTIATRTEGQCFQTVERWGVTGRLSLRPHDCLIEIDRLSSYFVGHQKSSRINGLLFHKEMELMIEFKSKDISFYRWFVKKNIWVALTVITSQQWNIFKIWLISLCWGAYYDAPEGQNTTTFQKASYECPLLISISSSILSNSV